MYATGPTMAAQSGYVGGNAAYAAGGTGAYGGGGQGAYAIAGQQPAGTCCGGLNHAGECAGACGGMEVACCEAQGAVTQTNWAFVGQGNGGYNSVQSYQYVGDGCGSFDKETTTTYWGWKFRKCCIGVGGCLLIPALLWLLIQILNPEPNPGPDPSTPPPIIVISTPAPSPAPEPNRPLYDCSKQGLWTLAKRDWCCKHYGRGCPTHPPTPPVTTPCPTHPPVPHPVPIPAPAPVPVPHPVVPTSLPYDCNADFLNCYHCLMKRWSVSKRAWCCAHARRGCPTGAPPVPPAPLPPTTSLPYDCAAGFSNWQAGWSVGKKAWCCEHQHKGCPPPPPATTSLPFDCAAGYSNWEAGWSIPKKAWCCQHQHKGCPPHPPGTSACPPMDCAAAYNNWRAAWGPEKKTYCCQHENKGCE